MRFLNNPDWENASKRMEAFWENEMLDRPCVQIYGCGECCGELFSNHYPNWEGVPLMLGANVVQGNGTIWVRPTVHSILDLDMNALSISSSVVTEYLSWLEDFTKQGAGGRFTGMPPLGNPGDCFAKIIGYTDFCAEIIEETEAVIKAEAKLTAFWKKLYDACYDATTKYQRGSSASWLPIWYPGRCVLLECDLGALISTEAYKVFFPFILERATYGERNIYHLDGPDAVVHLDALLAQPEINAIQWEPGIQCKDITEWIPLMQKIQNAGKALFIAGPRYPKEQILKVMKELKPGGVVYPIYLPDRAEAEEFLETATKMYK